MSAQDELVAAGQRLLINNYRQAPVVFNRGAGCELWDVSGRRYLDMTAGIAVCVLGHADPGLADVIAAQARQLIHASNLYYLENQVRLADALSRRAFRGRVFFCNSGTEANEAALKIARRYQAVAQKRPDRVELVAFENSFHGRTMGALAVTGQAKYRDGFGPLITPVRFLPYGDIAAARAAITPSTCAVIVEPIQAEGGILVPPPGYLQELRRHCTETGTVLIFDEVQTGSGRTGTFYAFENEGVVPDVVTLAKGLAGGVPIGAMLANEDVARGFEPGSHAATFGGNPLATAGALHVQQVIDRDNLLERCRDAGAYLGSSLLRLSERRRPWTRGARGRGLLQGLVLDGDAAPVVARARDAGLLVSVAGGNVIRFAPALVVSRDHVDEAVAILDDVLGQQGRLIMGGNTLTLRKDFLSFWDLPDGGIETLIRRAEEFRLLRSIGEPHATRPGRVLGMVFEKASTRTRASFEIAMFELGGHGLYLGSQGSQLERGEPIRDTARVLSGYCHAIMIRTFGQNRAEELAGYASVPVINGLTDLLHPCQVLADLQTVYQHGHRPQAASPDATLTTSLVGDVLKTLRSMKYAWVGDGNNMANSWIEAAGILGLDLALACPKGYEPDAAVFTHARQTERGRIVLTHDPAEALAGRHVISTDVFASMGQEREAEARRAAFAGYCIDAALMAKADPGAIVLHCLPAHRGEEISDDVIEGPQSHVWRQAENRLHAQKALLEALLAPPAK